MGIFIRNGEPMKKIALIMDGWKRFFTYAWPAGSFRESRKPEKT